LERRGKKCPSRRGRKSVTTAAGLALTILLGTITASAQQKPAADEPTIDMQWAVKIPARDGVKLNATVFTPHGQKDPLPAIFTFTPYIGDSYTERAVVLCEAWLRLRAGDVRGRGNSGGEFEPFVNEGKDGYDVVEWLARQPYCNGKVTMWAARTRVSISGRWSRNFRRIWRRSCLRQRRIPEWIFRFSTTFSRRTYAMA